MVLRITGPCTCLPVLEENAGVEMKGNCYHDNHQTSIVLNSINNTCYKINVFMLLPLELVQSQLNRPVWNFRIENTRICHSFMKTKKKLPVKCNKKLYW